MRWGGCILGVRCVDVFFMVEQLLLFTPFPSLSLCALWLFSPIFLLRGCPTKGLGPSQTRSSSSSGSSSSASWGGAGAASPSELAWVWRGKGAGWEIPESVVGTQPLPSDPSGCPAAHSGLSSCRSLGGGLLGPLEETHLSPLWSVHVCVLGSWFPPFWFVSTWFPPCLQLPVIWQNLWFSSFLGVFVDLFPFVHLIVISVGFGVGTKRGGTINTCAQFST